MSDSWLVGLTQGMPTDQERLEKALESLPLEELHKLAQDVELSPRPSQMASLEEKMKLADALGRQLAHEHGDIEKTAWMPTGAVRGLIGKAIQNPHLGMAAGGAMLGAAGGAAKGLLQNPGVDAYGRPNSRLGAMASGALSGAALGGAVGGAAGYLPTGRGMDVAGFARRQAISPNSKFLNPALRADLRAAGREAGRGVPTAGAAPKAPAAPAAPAVAAAPQPAPGGWWDRAKGIFTGKSAPVQSHLGDVIPNAPAPASRPMTAHLGDEIPWGAGKKKLAMSPPPIPGSIGHRLAQSAAAARASRPTVESLAQKMLVKRPPPIPGQAMNLPPIVG